ncbi:MAG TPA: hypothetical protein VHP35_04730, partial [Terriglobia bacterium]|nr:hypothetical protein [Terriglobia bacterium]
MELQHVNIKLYLGDPQAVKLETLVPVFHGWIQSKACDELLIDVADYRHVHAGPGVVLIGHEADYSVDNTDNRLGIRYNRKAALGGSNRDRFSQALRGALLACQRLEADEKLNGTLRFDRRNMKLFINDRMLAPNAGNVSDAVQAELRDFFTDVCGDPDVEMQFDRNSRRLLGVTVTTARPLDLDRM